MDQRYTSTDPSSGADPRVSVVIPSYNQPDEFLSACLTSLCAQTLTSWEAIVVDDGSTCGSVADVVAAQGDGRIRAVRHEQNRGMGAARNSGFRMARAALVLTLDADDRLDPEFLALTASLLQTDAACECVFTDSECFGGSTDVLRFPAPLPPPCPQHPTYPDTGVLMRKALWEEVGGYAEDRALGGVEWWDLWLTAIERARGLRVRHIPLPLYKYRIHGAGASVTFSMYDDYRNRELIYRRHRHSFDSFRGPCSHTPHPSVRAFRASGYVTSSRASLARGEVERAVRLAIRGLTIHPWSRVTTRQVIRVLLGEPPSQASLRST